MSRLGRIVSTALITAGLVVIADVAITLAYKEPLSSIYASIRQDEAASQLRELEASYPTPADRRAIAELRSGRSAGSRCWRGASPPGRAPARRSGGSSPRRWTG